MKKRNTIIPIIITILLVAILTNPSSTDYKNWVKQIELKQIHNSREKEFVSVFGNSIIKNSTTSKNYFIFSTYDTVFDKKSKIRVIGIFNNFIVYLNKK